MEVQGMEANPLCPQLPVFDLDVFLRQPEGSQQLCEALSRCLLEASALVVRDPRIDQAASDAFLDMMEDYFDQPRELKMPDVHPELAYQPELLRVAGAGPDAPTAPTGPDSKWRFFWRVGARPQHTRFAELNAPPVVPGAFGDRWAGTMDGWGLGLVRTAETVAQMAARGWGLAPDAFTQRMRHGPHLLAPTGVDLGAEPAPGAVFAGFHTDLNFLTVHGASRYPGLFIWLRDGRRIAVRIPRGCILLQAGTQLEHLTGGAVRAGFHEVVCVPEALEAARRAGARPPGLARLLHRV
ncbi:hypothetical protein QBZ16_003777 [Prototheca wickerhamii]|uniref:Isopenicillin N synthase-like Fe(2+) 2OG dioxygenase domain-containing protein n=1 Tax=Prototheca wickerhamii TaxID=3111 RepID=A0AAD9MH32_PROWI|nr:hypothetical protein QBZ16_003777 [Prototheca wickerhamii]